MFNRGYRAISLALVSLSLLWLAPSATHAAGTIPLSMTQQLDQYGGPLSGCKLYIIQAGTTGAPQNAFKDTALLNAQPYPMLCDSSGRLPQFFLADGLVKIRLEDKFGNIQTVSQDNILVIGPSAGGGSGATIDPTTIAATGDLKHAYGTQVITGWVRLNGRTIGNAISGATERANADTQALFLYLWATDPNLTVSGGRTTAAADYAANKTITLPDAAGRALSGLDDMGAGAKGRLTAVGFGAASVTALGSAGGADNFAQTLAHLPTGITAAGSTTVAVSPPAGNSVPYALSGAVQNNPGTPTSGGGNSPFTTAGSGALWSFASSLTGSGSASVTSNNTGAQAAGGAKNLPTVGPRLLVTIYIKL